MSITAKTNVKSHLLRTFREFKTYFNKTVVHQLKPNFAKKKKKMKSITSFYYLNQNAKNTFKSSYFLRR